MQSLSSRAEEGSCSRRRQLRPLKLSDSWRTIIETDRASRCPLLQLYCHQCKTRLGDRLDFDDVKDPTTTKPSLIHWLSDSLPAGVDRGNCCGGTLINASRPPADVSRASELQPARLPLQMQPCLKPKICGRPKAFAA